MKLLSVLSLMMLVPQDNAWKDSYAKAADYLVKGQGEDGMWGREFQGKRFPSLALTCLSIDALVRMPADLKEKYKAQIQKGIDVIAQSQDEKDGSWAEPPGQLKAYVTSIAMMALNAHDAAKYKDPIAKGQKYLADIQQKEGFWTGSTGYGEVQYEMKDGKMQPKKSDSGNMSTTDMAAEAMKETGYSEKEYWDKVVEFLTKCQNNSEKNIDPEWLKMLESKGYKVGNDGGFYYKPDPAQADNYGGSQQDADGNKIISSYGSMTYDGLKTYIFAGLAKDDPRVKAAVDWARKNYTLDRHPGFPYEKDQPVTKRKDNQGLYYYYMAMARSLDAYGENPFVTDDGKKHDWPKELGEKLVSLQKPDGSWVNEQVRWWEGDPMLCTPYVLKIYAILGKYHGK